MTAENQTIQCHHPLYGVICDGCNCFALDHIELQLRTNPDCRAAREFVGDMADRSAGCNYAFELEQVSAALPSSEECLEDPIDYMDWTK